MQKSQLTAHEATHAGHTAGAAKKEPANPLLDSLSLCTVCDKNYTYQSAV